MIRINLLPYRAERRQKQILQHLLVALGAVALAVLISITAHWIASSKLSNLQNEYAQLQQRNKVLMKEIGKIKNLDRLRADVERKLKLVQQLQQGRFKSLNTFVELARVIPENVWLTSVIDKGKQIQLHGYGESNNAVANFMRSLDRSSLFTNVNLSVIQRADVGGANVRVFDLVIDRTNKPMKKKKGGKS